MAKINQGILGPFSGKVGEVIGSSWKGIPYIKARSTQFHDAKSPRQLTHRMKLQMAHGFARSVKHIIEIGFRNVTGAQTPYNNAVSCLMKHALLGEYLDVGIAPSKVLISQGKLAGAENCSVSVEKDDSVAFSWGEASYGGKANVEDQAILLAYNFTKQQGISKVVCRKDKKGSIKIPVMWKGDCIACYIFFASTENEEVSDSKHLDLQEKTEHQGVHDCQALGPTELI